MAKRRKTVSYVVGTALDAPLVVTHVLPEEERESKPQEGKKRCTQVQQSKNCVAGVNISKRVCGHSQKEARVKYQQRKKLNRNPKNSQP